MRRVYSCFFVFVILILFLASPLKVFAKESIKSFETEIVAHKDGTMDVTEKIIYDFSDNLRHGIYRDIPLVSKVNSNLYRVIKINFNNILRDGQEENYSNNSTSSKASVKIGRADTEITGEHTYTISYSVENGIGSNFEDHDEIYWNVTGDEWQVPIEKASSSLSTDFGEIPNKADCFTGPFGSKEKNCDASQINIVTAESLNSYEGLTAVWGFPKDTFPKSILQTESPSTGPNPFIFKVIVFSFLIITNLLIAPALIFWYLKFKRKKNLGKPAVNFDIPKDNKSNRITPAEAGSIDVHRVEKDDIIATFFDLAIRKYIKIEEIKKEKTLGFFGGEKDYLITKVNDSEKDLENFERILLSKIFEKEKVAKLSALKEDFYKTFSLIENEVFNSLIAKGLYSKNPKLQMSILLVFGLMVFFIGAPMLGIVMIFLSRKLNGRTKLGDEIDLKNDGLKIFLKNMKENYKWQAKNLYIVEQMIPYAIAFGFIKEFMEQLKEIYPDYSPSWYRGNVAFYAGANNMLSSMSTAFVTSAPSSSSGFSGGSSGGGGGGGGGGSW